MAAGKRDVVASPEESRAVSDYWDREGLAQTILDYLGDSGKNVNALTVEGLAQVDQFHTGGLIATTELAELAEISKWARVLDVGGGLGDQVKHLGGALKAPHDDGASDVVWTKQALPATVMDDDLPAIRLAGKRNTEGGRLSRARAAFVRP